MTCPREYVFGPLGDTIAAWVMVIALVLCFARVLWEINR